MLLAHYWKKSPYVALPWMLRVLQVSIFLGYKVLNSQRNSQNYNHKATAHREAGHVCGQLEHVCLDRANIESRSRSRQIRGRAGGGQALGGSPTQQHQARRRGSRLRHSQIGARRFDSQGSDPSAGVAGRGSRVGGACWDEAAASVPQVLRLQLLQLQQQNSTKGWVRQAAALPHTACMKLLRAQSSRQVTSLQCSSSSKEPRLKKALFHLTAGSKQCLE
jgi:hypothetical protein